MDRLRPRERHVFSGFTKAEVIQACSFPFIYFYFYSVNVADLVYLYYCFMWVLIVFCDYAQIYLEIVYLLKIVCYTMVLFIYFFSFLTKTICFNFCFLHLRKC
jgi:hypothetical protein